MTAESLEKRRRYAREWARKKYWSNPEVARAKHRARAWEKKNPEKHRRRSNAWRAANLELARLKDRERYRRDKPKRLALLKQRRRIRRTEDPAYSLLLSMRSRVGLALKGAHKCANTWKLIGCSRDFLLTHLECQFWPGMSWSNYGRWHVDHVVPCAAFDLPDSKQQQECFHWTNLRPLWAEDNQKKGAKYYVVQ